MEELQRERREALEAKAVLAAEAAQLAQEKEARYSMTIFDIIYNMRYLMSYDRR